MTDMIEAEPIEGPGTELANVLSEGDPDVVLAILEKKAELAPRWNRALNTILVTQTYPEDWTEQGGKMCLSSAGAERVARLFTIRFHDSKCEKQTFSDAIGSGYRYVYECKALLGDREVFAQGAYSTRDKFLGFAGGAWRATEDINENNIRNAAYHICIGNAIKALLGLRGIPASRFQQIMGHAGEDASKAATVTRGSGTQGGTNAEEAAQQKELAEACIYIAQAGMTVARGTDGTFHPVAMSDADERDAVERGKAICVELSSFTNKEGKAIRGKLASDLHAKWLGATLGNARKVKAEVDAEADSA